MIFKTKIRGHELALPIRQETVDRWRKDFDAWSLAKRQDLVDYLRWVVLAIEPKRQPPRPETALETRLFDAQIFGEGPTMSGRGPLRQEEIRLPLGVTVTKGCALYNANQIPRQSDTRVIRLGVES